jgi:hypothetical protein
MLYVALAERLGATLVTADAQLARRLATVPHIQALSKAARRGMTFHGDSVTNFVIIPCC